MKKEEIAKQKPKVVGITGGIGSGKTTLVNWFEKDGIPVYNSDLKAKQLMVEDENLKKSLVEEFGKEVFEDGLLNRPFLAKIVFENPIALQKINQLVHPVVFVDFNDWYAKQKSSFVIKEAAILFESGAYKSCDWVVLVISDKEKRVQRVIERDRTSREDVLNRMDKQWSDEDKIANAHFVVENDFSINHFKEKYKLLFSLLLENSKITDNNQKHFHHPHYI